MNIQKKKKRLGINHIDYNAGNVEHNIAMFNKMNNPTSTPSTNPVSGPMGESLKEGLINDEAKMYVLELVLSEYETGHTLVDDYNEFARLVEEEDFTADTDMWNLYLECHDLGPVGFYEEYKNILDFSDEFKSEYAYEEEMDDEDFEIIEEGLTEAMSLDVLVKDSINHLVNAVGKDSGADDFADDVVRDIENNYPTEVPEDMDTYNKWASEVMSEVSRQLNNTINEANEESVNDKVYEVRQIDDKGNELDQFLEFDSKEEAINKAKTINTPVEVKEMTKSMKESIGSDEKVIWTNLNMEEDLDEGMSRQAMIDALKGAGKDYNFDRFSDAQLYRMYEKDVFLKPEAPKRPSRRSMMINPYENTCEECGARLNDMGQCPKCIHGEEDLTEATLTEAPKWWEARKAKKAEDDRIAKEKAEREEAIKNDPQAAREAKDEAKINKYLDYIKNIGKIISPAFGTESEDYRFLVDGKLYDQEGYEDLINVKAISNLIKSGKILQTPLNSPDMKMLAKAIDTVIITPQGKIIRRGLEDLSKHPINYIRGRTDLTDIAPKYSSKILQLVNQAVSKTFEDEDETPREETRTEPRAEEPTTPPDTTSDKPETTSDKPETTGTAPVESAPDSSTSWVTHESIQAAVTLLAKRKNGPTIYYDKAGNSVRYDKVTVDNVNDLFVDKEGKQPLVDVMKSIKDKMAQRKAQIVKQAALFGEDVNKEDKEILTEAPIITLDDNDINNPSEVDFRKKISQAQAKEDAAKEAERAEAERAIYRRKYGKVTSVLEDGLKNGKDSTDILEDINSILVPARDECDTVAGEIVRAMMRILYRWYNDGDRFYQGYGLETVGGSASYLASQIKSIEKLIDHLLQDYDYSYDNDDKYEQFIIEMTDNVVDYLRNNENAIFTPNVEDSREWDAEYLEENQPRYEYELPISDDISTLVDNQIITAWDLNEYVDDWMGWNSVYDGAECSRPWSQYSAEVTVENLTKDGLGELEYTFQKNGHFSDEAVDEFWKDLVDEHRDELEDEDDMDYEDSYDDEEDYSTDIDVDDEV